MTHAYLRGLSTVALATFVSASTVWAYEEVAVPDGGTIRGTVILEGKVPRPKGYNLTTLPDPVYCGRISDGQGWRLLQPFRVGENGAFRQVIVFIESIDKGKPFVPFTPPRIEARDCRFLPFVNLVRDEHEVVVVNMDPAMHDIQAYETSHLGPRVLFNMPLPISKRYPKQMGSSAHVQKHFEGTPITQAVRMTNGREVFVMQCGFHSYMESWALVARHPYYAITDKDGRFELTDVPPGDYTIKLWHPYVRETIEQKVTVEAKGAREIALTVTAPTGRLYANQMVENPYTRYNITEDVKSQIAPTLEKQSY